MRLRYCIIGFWSLFMIAGCGGEHDRASQSTPFSKADSLTEIYLALQDTVLEVWNTMIFDDNRKIVALQNLLHELQVSNPDMQEELQHFEQRLQELKGIRYDQSSMSNPELVIEYDFASGSLLTELTSLAESQTEFAYNPTLRKLVEQIRTADERVMNYRAEYDDVATRFNNFIDEHRDLLDDMDPDFLNKRPLFQMAVE